MSIRYICALLILFGSELALASQSPRKTVLSIMEVAEDARNQPQSPRCSPRGCEQMAFWDYDDVLGFARSPESDEERPLREGEKTQAALKTMQESDIKQMILTSRGWRYLGKSPNDETPEAFEAPDEEMKNTFKDIAHQMYERLHEGLDQKHQFLFEPFGEEVRMIKFSTYHELTETEQDTYMIIYKGIIFSGPHKGVGLSLFLNELKTALSKDDTAQVEGKIAMPQLIRMTDDNESYLDLIEQELSQGLAGISLELYHFPMDEAVVK
ncbi:MAG: hypothetical protein K2X53_01090 [Alphaproteobacteria bacterium]|nr:hypothetical protein [Alphaproteobacteria bacterium]